MGFGFPTDGTGPVWFTACDTIAARPNFAGIGFFKVDCSLAFAAGVGFVVTAGGFDNDLFLDGLLYLPLD